MCSAQQLSNEKKKFLRTLSHLNSKTPRQGTSSHSIRRIRREARNVCTSICWVEPRDQTNKQSNKKSIFFTGIWTVTDELLLFPSLLLSEPPRLVTDGHPALTLSCCFFPWAVEPWLGLTDELTAISFSVLSFFFFFYLIFLKGFPFKRWRKVLVRKAKWVTEVDDSIVFLFFFFLHLG